MACDDRKSAEGWRGMQCGSSQTVTSKKAVVIHRWRIAPEKDTLRTDSSVCSLE